MKAAVARKPLIRVAVVESDPLRFVGFRALFDTEPDLELVSASLADLAQLQAIDLVLLGNRGGQNLYDIMASMKAVRPDLRIIVTGSGMDDESVLKAIAAGAKGYVDEAASPAEFIQALRILQQRNRLRLRHRRTHREGSRRQTDAQSRSAEPHRLIGTCHHAFVGDG